MTLTEFNQTDRSARSSSLDIRDDEMRDLSAQFVALARDYFAGVSQMPVFTQKTGDEIKRQFEAMPPVEGEPLAIEAEVHGRLHGPWPRNLRRGPSVKEPLADSGRARSA